MNKTIKNWRPLIIPDLHLPAEHPKALQFCQDLYDEWRCNDVIFMGDVSDFHAISFHVKNPDLSGPGDEYDIVREKINTWKAAFPKATVILGNHDLRPFRLGRTVSIPDRLIKSPKELWDTSKWEWILEAVINRVYFIHNAGGGIYPAINKAKNLGISVVCGHTHSNAGIHWTASPLHRFFGMNVGCLIDIDRLQFEYGQVHLNRPILGAGVIIKDIPYFEVMPCGKEEKYYKGNKL
jgi:hypothetical protein